MVKIFLGLILSCVFMSQLKYTFCHIHSDVTRLIEDLFNETKYSKLVRPIHNQDEIMKVNITPGITTFEILEVTSGELLTFSYVQLSWIDEFLVWNPEEYGGITKLSIPFNKLWVPSLSQSSGALKENNGHIINPGFAPVIVLPNGFVLLVTTGYYVTKCEIDTRFYPFDSHLCNFVFFSALHDTTEMDLNSQFSDLALGLLEDNYAWYKTNTRYKKIIVGAENIAFSLSGVKFTITLKRRPTFELIYSYFPILLLTVLNIATNFVPANSGERLTFAITLYLSFIFITSALVDGMPQVSVNIAFSSYIMLALNVLNTTSVLWSVIVVRLSGWKTCTRPIPGSLKKLVEWYKQKSSKKIKVHPTKTDLDVEDLDYSPDAEVTGENEMAGNVEVTDDMAELTWLDVAEVLDKIYFTIATVLVACVILVMACLWMLSE